MSISNELRKLRYRCLSWSRHPELKPSDEPIDVVIPIIAKDLKILPLCLEGVRKCVCHTIKQIYIVAPAQKEIIDFCTANDLEFVNENDVFGYAPKDLKIILANGSDRSGWLFQQFVKLSGAIGTCRYYLCIDADHVLIHPHVFLTDKQETVFYLCYEDHQPYYDIIRRIMPDLEIANLSYVDHKMLFDKEQLHELHETLSRNHGGKPWQQVITDNLDYNEQSGFSEFETYGNFVQRKVLRPWQQKRLPYRKIADYDTLRSKYAKWFRWTLTFPDYMRENKQTHPNPSCEGGRSKRLND